MKPSMPVSATRITLIACITLICMAGHSQIRINEICAENHEDAGFLDGFGNASDWIELYNAGSSTVNLLGYTITDDPDYPEKYQLSWITIDPDSFVIVFASGRNTVINVYEDHTNFKLSDNGEEIALFDDQGALVDAVTFPALRDTHTYGRFPDGNANWYYFENFTPDSNNTGSTGYNGYATTPIFSLQPGFYSGQQTLTITSPDNNAVIRHSTGGAYPDTAYGIYAGAITIDSTTVVKAVAWQADSMITPSEQSANTYFIDEDFDLPVFSISMHPDTLFDDSLGIYMEGPNADTAWPHFGANYWEDKEVQAYFEYFGRDKQLKTESGAGFKIHGDIGSRPAPMKSVRLVARDEYGASWFNHDFFRNRNTNLFKRLILRNGGGDYIRLHMRDGAVSRLMLAGSLNIDVLCYEPVHVFFNGEYWGLHNLRERSDIFYVQTNFGANPDETDVLENNALVIYGDSLEFLNVVDFVKNSDMTQPWNYNQAKAYLDISNFCDYMISETYLCNFDWPQNNVRLWKNKNGDNKWRYIMLDMDETLDNFGWAAHYLDNLGRILDTIGDKALHTQMLKNLLNNTEFRNYFINRYADLINTTFHPNFFQQVVDSVAADIRSDLPLQFAKWGSSMGWWEYLLIDRAEGFINNRPAYARQYIGEAFSLNGQVDLTLRAYPPGAGNILINTIIPDSMPWNGIYFNGVPVTLTAIPDNLHDFHFWQSANTIKTKDVNQTITYNFTTGDTIVAYFEELDDLFTFNFYPNPANGMITLDFTLSELQYVTIGVYDIYGNMAKITQPKQYMGGVNSVQMNLSDLAAGVYLIQFSSSLGRETQKIILSGRPE